MTNSALHNDEIFDNEDAILDDFENMKDRVSEAFTSYTTLSQEDRSIYDMLFGDDE